MGSKLRTIYLPNMEHGDTSTHYWLFFSGVVAGAFVYGVGIFRYRIDNGR